MEDTFTNLAAFLNSLDAEGEQKFELSHSLVIICPDCGKNIAFRGRCPKCGGELDPGGHHGGVFERMKAERLRRMVLRRRRRDPQRARATVSVLPSFHRMSIDSTVPSVARWNVTMMSPLRSN